MSNIIPSSQEKSSISKQNTDVSRFLSAIWKPGEVREIRAFQDEKVTTYGYFDNPDTAASHMLRIEKTHINYVTLNPCNPALLARAENRLKIIKFEKVIATSDKDIDRLIWLLIDCDPVRPAGISSSDEELVEAQKLAEAINAGEGIPAILGMSGNGYHLIYSHDAKDEKQLKAYLETLDKKYSTERVKVDTKVFNPARISKVLGTWARKGDNTQTRPHRQSHIVAINENPTILHIPELPPPEPKHTPKPISTPKQIAEPFDSESYLRKVLAINPQLNVIQEKTVHGNPWFCLQECVFDSNHKKNESALYVSSNGKICYQCFHDSCHNRHWDDVKPLLSLPEPEQRKGKPCKYCGQEIFWKGETAFNDPKFTEKHKDTCHAREKKKQAQQKRQQEIDSLEQRKRELPEIHLQEGFLPHIVRQAKDALLASDSKSHYLSRIYQRSNMLVRVLISTEKSKRGIQRPENALIIQPIDAAYLVNHFTEAANWMRFDERLGDWKHTDCPKRIAETYMACAPWNVPVLVGIIEAPTLKYDGSILQTPGYDEETGLLYHPGNTVFPEIPENPSQNDAFEASAEFLHLLAKFPLVDQIALSVAISEILTALIRRSLSSAPIHGNDAPKAGSGKSLLVDVVSLIATGRRATVMSQAENGEEEKKRLLAVLMENDLVVCLDNVERPLQSDALCSILTQETWKERLLGQNKMVAVPTNTAFFATGNNLTFQGDLSTRALICRLDPQCERPEERSFDVNLYRYIPEHRGELVKAGLTILRAYHVAGRPRQAIAPYGRFEEWSNWVRSAIVWVKLEDPCKSRKRIEEADPVSANLKALFSAWYECLGSEPKTVKALIEAANLPVNANLKDVLFEIAGDRQGNIDQRKLSYRLRMYKDRIENGLSLKHAGVNRANLVLWEIKKIENT